MTRINAWAWLGSWFSILKVETHFQWYWSERDISNNPPDSGTVENAVTYWRSRVKRERQFLLLTRRQFVWRIERVKGLKRAFLALRS